MTLSDLGGHTLSNKKFATLLVAGCMAVMTACGGTSTGDNAGTKNEGADVVNTETANVETDKIEYVSDGTDISYPITITHAYGETVITEKPENIVTLGWGNQDVPLALGVIPSGVSMANFGPVNENGLLEWTADKFTELGVENPNVFSDIDGWDYEAISNAEPDVILAAYSGFSEEEYEMLSQIAPVVAYPSTAWSTDWREMTILDATAMGMEAEGRQLVDDIDALIEEKLNEYPDVEGKTAAFAWMSADDLGVFYIYLPTDPRANFLLDLGLKFPESVAEMVEDENAFSITVSSEYANQLSDIDILITYGDESLLEALQADPLFSEIPAVVNGAIVLLDSSSALSASSTPSPLSIPATIDEYLSVLQEAAEKVNEN